MRTGWTLSWVPEVFRARSATISWDDFYWQKIFVGKDEKFARTNRHMHQIRHQCRTTEHKEPIGWIWSCPLCYSRWRHGQRVRTERICSNNSVISNMTELHIPHCLLTQIMKRTRLAFIVIYASKPILVSCLDFPNFMSADKWTLKKRPWTLLSITASEIDTPANFNHISMPDSYLRGIPNQGGLHLAIDVRLWWWGKWKELRALRK